MRRFVQFIVVASFAVLFAAPSRAVEAGKKEIDDLNASAKKALDSRQYESAEKLYRRVLESQPQNHTALLGLGDTLTAEGKFADAANAYDRLADAIMKTVPAAPQGNPQARRTAPSPAPAPATAPAATAKLMPPPAHINQKVQGWCGYVQVGRQGGLYIQFMSFTPEGYIYTGPPSNESLPQLQQRDPDHFGTYTWDGKTLDITYASGKKETRSYDRNLCNDFPVQVAGAVKGPTLDGLYSASSNAMTFGHVTAMAGGMWTFHTDGTFKHETYTGVETARHATGTGESAANAGGSQGAQTSGKYTIDKGVLTLNGTEKHSIYYLGTDNPPSYLAIDGMTFTHH